jgi:hypothetical protein
MNSALWILRSEFILFQRLFTIIRAWNLFLVSQIKQRLENIALHVSQAFETISNNVYMCGGKFWILDYSF